MWVLLGLDATRGCIMTQRFIAPLSGNRLDEVDAAIVKGTLAKGDRQHDIAAWFGVSGGRVGEISTGAKFAEVRPAEPEELPPQDPYLSGRQSAELLAKLGFSYAAQ